MNPKKESSDNIRILAIESSCDETAAAVLVNGQQILSNVVASQIDLHAKFGGVFPEMASRQHVLAIYPVVQDALKQAHLSLNELDAIAVTRGPGFGRIACRRHEHGQGIGNEQRPAPDRGQPPGRAFIFCLDPT